MNIAELRYTENLEWVFVEDGIAIVGISKEAAARGCISVRLRRVGTKVKQFEKLGEIEWAKVICDVLSPLAGRVVQRNEIVKKTPSLVTNNPYGEGWLIKLAPDDVSELNNLMNFKEYQEYVFNIYKMKAKKPASKKGSIGKPELIAVVPNVSDQQANINQ